MTSFPLFKGASGNNSSGMAGVLERAETVIAKSFHKQLYIVPLPGDVKFAYIIILRISYLYIRPVWVCHAYDLLV